MPTSRERSRTTAVTLSGPESSEYLGVGRTTFQRLRAHPAFPKPVFFPGTSHPRWRRADLDKYIEASRNTPCSDVA